MLQKIKNFLSNKYFLLSLIIVCTVLITIAIGLGIGTMKEVPEEMLPLVKAFVAFMIMGTFSLIILVVVLFIVSGRVMNISKIKNVSVEIQPVPAPETAISAPEVAPEANKIE